MDRAASIADLATLLDVDQAISEKNGWPSIQQDDAIHTYDELKTGTLVVYSPPKVGPGSSNDVIHSPAAAATAQGVCKSTGIGGPTEPGDEANEDDKDPKQPGVTIDDNDDEVLPDSQSSLAIALGNMVAEHLEAMSDKEAEETVSMSCDEKNVDINTATNDNTNVPQSGSGCDGDVGNQIGVPPPPTTSQPSESIPAPAPAPPQKDLDVDAPSPSKVPKVGVGQDLRCPTPTDSPNPVVGSLDEAFDFWDNCLKVLVHGKDEDERNDILLGLAQSLEDDSMSTAFSGIRAPETGVAVLRFRLGEMLGQPISNSNGKLQHMTFNSNRFICFVV